MCVNIFRTLFQCHTQKYEVKKEQQKKLQINSEEKQMDLKVINIYKHSERHVLVFERLCKCGQKNITRNELTELSSLSKSCKNY